MVQLFKSSIEQLPSWQRALQKARYERPWYQPTAASVSSDGSHASYQVRGRAEQYVVDLDEDADGFITGSCSCPAGKADRPCYHLARVIMGEHWVWTALDLDPTTAGYRVMGEALAPVEAPDWLTGSEALRRFQGEDVDFEPYPFPNVPKAPWEE